jgi:hypothetical protein
MCSYTNSIHIFVIQYPLNTFSTFWVKLFITNTQFNSHCNIVFFYGYCDLSMINLEIHVAVVYSRLPTFIISPTVSIVKKENTDF